ncbi:hypothetical protein ABID23_000377 [Bartonella silvatica]|uniref:Uncharacterized protein n=1 Tax=Bartonella silvatica TaxID=357760 RepID=A0ABV2HFJ1_9HYPH
MCKTNKCLAEHISLMTVSVWGHFAVQKMHGIKFQKTNKDALHFLELGISSDLNELSL